MLEQKSFIGTLHVRGAERNDPALRLAISNQLSGADLKPPGLPPSGVLVVRKLADPLPGSFTIQPGSGRPDPEWERAVRRQLEDSFANAARPVGGKLPGNAEAIVFSDQAELLACLVSDIASGEAWQRWWWKAILKQIPLSFGPSACIRELLCERAMYLPTVAGHLAAWNQAEILFKNLQSQDSMTVLQALLTVHGFTELKAEIEKASTGLPGFIRDSDSSSQVRSTAGDRIESPVQTVFAGSEKPARPYHELSRSIPLTTFWQRYLPSLRFPAALRKEQLLLFGLSLSIFRIPQFIRSQEFQNEVIEWWQSPDNCVRGMRQHAHDQESSRVKHDARRHRSAASIKRRQAISPHEDRADAGQHDQPEGRFVTKDRQSKQSRGSVGAETDVKTVTAKESKNPQENKRGSLIVQGASEPSTIQAEADTAVSDIESVAEQPVSSLTGDFVHTRLGGVLYLINLMSQLNLPECFEQDWNLGSQLGRWAFLELLAHSLVGQAHVDDPLWKAFAELDQRPFKEPPGKYFTGASSYRMPLIWFEQMRSGEETFHWASSRGGIRLWSSQRHLLVEAPRCGKDPQAQAQAELQHFIKEEKYLLSRKAYSKAPLVHPAWLEKAGVSKDLTRWFTLTLPFVQRYLYSLLSTSDNVSGKRDQLKNLLLCPGKLYVTATHVDFVTDINNISISARMSGLDQNPGWLPEYGRVVLFHFE